MAGKKRRSDEEGGQFSGPPSKKPRMVEVNGELRRETLKEKVRRERQEKKEVKKAGKKDRFSNKGGRGRQNNAERHKGKGANGQANGQANKQPEQQPQEPQEPVVRPEPQLAEDGEAYIHPSRRMKNPNLKLKAVVVPLVVAAPAKNEAPAPAVNGSGPAEAKANGTKDAATPDKKSKKSKKNKKTEEAPKEDVPVENGDAKEEAVVNGAAEEKPKAKKEKKSKKGSKKVDAEVPAEAEATAPSDDAPQTEDGAQPDGKAKKAKKSKKEAKAADEAPAENGDVSMVDAPAEETSGATEEASKRDKKKKDKKEKKDKKDKKEKEKKDKSKDAEGSPTGAGYKQAEVAAFLKKEQVVITDPRKTTPVPRPILQFEHLPTTGLTVQKPFASFSQPTPIQSASWPWALAGRDLVGIAETGSGKTLAFALPCVEALAAGARPAPVEAKKLPSRSRLNNKWDGQGTVAQARAVVVSPTRELAMQTHAALAPLAAQAGLTAVCLYGGASKDEQRVHLRQKDGVDIIVATPGRLKDFLSDEAVSLAHVRFAVLDEADRMLDTGFEEDIRTILGACPAREQRQTLMFTATWPTSVRGLAEGFMVDPVKITIGGGARADGEEGESGDNNFSKLQANVRIAQSVEVLEQPAKERRLLQIIKQEQRGKAKKDRILVFCLYKKEAVRVENFLQGQGVRVCSIHGDLRQEQRTRSLEAFKTGETPVLVATDVAARGLDIPEVKLVINVTFPLTIEDYVHRIGRTGRAGKDGRAITFFTDHDKTHSGSLVNVLKAAGQPVPDELLKFGTTVKKRAHGDYGAFFKDVDMSQKGTKITFD